MFPKYVMLLDHLRYNHYPPVGQEWLKPAEEAITAVGVEEPDRQIDVPGGGTMTAGWIVESLHLDGFIEYPDDVDDLSIEEQVTCADCGRAFCDHPDHGE